MGYTDSDLTLEIMPGKKPAPNHGMPPTAAADTAPSVSQETST